MTAARKHKWDLTSLTVWENFTEVVSHMRLAGQKPQVEFVTEKRSLSQNDMSFALYKQIGAQAEDQSISDIRRECKLVHGIPILRRDDEQFRALYNKSILHNLSYEEKLLAMEWFPVTRMMNKTQFSEYLDTVIREYSKQGYSLIHPSEAER